jgi:hypothetical protein
MLQEMNIYYPAYRRRWIWPYLLDQIHLEKLKPLEGFTQRSVAKLLAFPINSA